MKKITKANLVREFILQNPNVRDKRDIARQMCRLYPDRFTNIDLARSTVTRVTGSHGQGRGNLIKSPHLQRFFFNGFEKWSRENLNIEERPWDNPFVIPTSIKELNIISDLHSVHLDYKVLDKFLKSVKNKEALLINGDLIDSETLSRHLISHNAVEYDKEIEICRQILQGLKQEFNHIYFKEGNHDFWLERYLLINSRAMLNTFRERGVNVKELLQCGGLGIHHIHNLQYIQYGDLDIIHGHEFNGFGTSKFPSVGLLDKWQSFRKRYDVKILQAHSHKYDKSISRKSKDGLFGESYVMPAMCRKAPQYNPYGSFDNGWALARINDEGKTEISITVV